MTPSIFRLSIVAVLFALVACDGDDGAVGSTGPAGAPGQVGAPGADN